MQNIILGITSFLIATAAYVFGIIKLFKREKPMYLQLIVCATGCFVLQQLSYLVNIWCNVTATFNIGMIGIFGCNYFLLSANYGTLDKIVDDGTNSKKARLGAAIAPVVMATLITLTFLFWKDKDKFQAVVWVLMLFPVLPASYYNMKHILLPMDDFKILHATRPCNIAALIFYIVSIAYAIFSAIIGISVNGIFSVLMSFSVLILTLCAVKGDKRWGI